MKRSILLVIMAGSFLLLSGCKDPSEVKWPWEKETPASGPTEPPLVETVPDAPVDEKLPPEVLGTVGQYVAIISGGDRPVGSWGLLVGLGQNGSSEIPSTLRNTLVSYIRGDIGIGLVSTGGGPLSAAQFLDDKDTALVRVDSVIPPGAPKGTKLDVLVRAWPGTQTRSLAGGLLLPIELKWERGQTSDNSRHFTSFGRAEGPIFVNPFLDPEKSEDRAKLRYGRILNGLTVVKDMPLRLQLYKSDFARCNLVQRVINKRFNDMGKRVANGRAGSYVELEIPEDWKKDYVHFIELVMHLPMRSGTSAYASKANQIAREIAKPKANYPGLALVWEAMGQEILPIIQKSYSSLNQDVVFYAARTGFRLGDARLAGPIMIRFAQTNYSPHRIEAIEELGAQPGYRPASKVLSALLDDHSAMVRVAAYEALLKRGDQLNLRQYAIDQGEFEQDTPAFLLDIVNSRAEGIAFATRTGQPKIVLFGRNIPLVSPLFYNNKEYGVMIFSRGPLKEDEIKALIKQQPPAYQEDYEKAIEKAHKLFLTRKKGDTSVADDADPLENLFKSHVAVYRRLPKGGISQQFHIGFRVDELIRVLGGTPRPLKKNGRVSGLGLTYGQVVSIVSDLCKRNSIQAKFVLQPLPQIQTIYKTLPGSPVTPGERPE